MRVPRRAEPGAVAGFVTGAIGAVIGVLATPMLGERGDALVGWVELNLGASFWVFAVVLAAFTVCLEQLRELLEDAEAGARTEADATRRIVRLDQVSDVLAHLFVGVGVVWTAVGMRAALQTTLAGDTVGAAPGALLAGLVDGGILLALSTTIVGAVGGYLLRLWKTLTVGAALHGWHEARGRGELRALLDTAARIEARLPETADVRAST